MQEIKVHEFASRLKELLSNSNIKMCFFLGAGCSVSSGIPLASTLTEKWIEEIKEHKSVNDDELDEFLKDQIENYDSSNLAKHYGDIMKLRFNTPLLRQQEIERLCEIGTPGFGYGIFAQLLSVKEYCSQCNIVLTTNFDDLIADAMYFYALKRPLVVSHESLISFVKITSPRPLVIKLHGDAKIQPKNTLKETAELDKKVSSFIQMLLKESGIVFIGYGGNDNSIYKILNELPEDALPYGSFWVDNKIPDNDVGKWLEENDAIWVNHCNFDELMLLLFEKLELKHPDDNRFEEINCKYRDAFTKLTNGIKEKDNGEEKKSLEKAADIAAKEFKDWYSVWLEASKYEKINPDKAEAVYLGGLKDFDDSEELHGSYALFLENIRKEFDKAELFYKKALELGPNDAGNLVNYALFLKNIRNSYDKAEEYYLKALKLRPDNPIVLGNYAIFLDDIRNDYDTAETYYKKALERDPKNIKKLGNYAVFLDKVRKAHDQAEEYYRKALELDSNDSVNLGQYAIFLKNVRKDYDLADEYFKKALETDANNVVNLGNYANFLKNIKRSYNLAEELYKKALENEPQNANILGSYASFLNKIRKDYNHADEYFKKSLYIEPNNSFNLANYSGFLLTLGKYNESEEYLHNALKTTKELIVKLECNFYYYAHIDSSSEQNKYLQVIKKLIIKNERSYHFDLTDNVNRAIEDGHPEPEFLKVLAKVIADDVDANELEKFDIWRNTSIEDEDESK